MPALHRFALVAATRKERPSGCAREARRGKEGIAISDPFIFLLTLAAALGCGLVAGVFFAFSTFVMKALSRIPTNQGIAAMQSINVVVLNRMFLSVFIGTAVVCLAIVACSFWQWGSPGMLWRVGGCACYLAGSFGVTLAWNVPRNEGLAAIDPSASASADLWRRYVAEWTAGNHVRTIASFAGAVFFSLALG
ncbi:MAG TPA: anthrone oxygenase family protein [Burkholderiales bacterium]|nr:anthrone oxygenase family protein [Burkholderiales bacterium]